MGFNRFCSSPAFNVSKYTVVSAVQISWNAIYARIQISNPNFKTCNKEMPNSLIYPSSMLFTPCWQSYKIKSEVYGTCSIPSFAILLLIYLQVSPVLCSLRCSQMTVRRCNQLLIPRLEVDSLRVSISCVKTILSRSKPVFLQEL